MDLREWITVEHQSAHTRFAQQVGAHVPYEMWRDPAGPGGSSIAWLVFHTTLHADLAVNSVLRGEQPLIDHLRSRLGLAGFGPSVGLGEREVVEATAAFDLDALGDYVDAVHAAIEAWLARAPEQTFTTDLDAPANGPLGLQLAGIPEADVPWLYRMWTGQPASYFLQWEAIGHRINHIGEMVAVRNRLGLSPF